MTYALPTVFQEYIAVSRYARYRPDLGRRENWDETVRRLFSFWKKQLPSMDVKLVDELQDAVGNLDVMPSMRSLMTAGPALERDNVAGYNCAASAIKGIGPTVSILDDAMKEAGFEEPIVIEIKYPIVFDELMYILLVGTGGGFSVERQFISQLPTVGKKLSRNVYKKTAENYPGVAKAELSSFDKKTNTIIVHDSKYGWASSLRIFIVEMYNGNFEVAYDVSGVRPAGSPLKTFGGRASGPEPLKNMFENIRAIFKAANGRKLTSIECHDVVCHIAAAIVVGGTRRSALISLSNLSDERMRYAKSGEWWNNDAQRALANNSVAYTEKPEVGIFMREWQALYESKSGERGISNREATKKACVRTGRDPNHNFIFNP